MQIGATDLGGVQQTALGDRAIGLSRKGILDGPKPGSPLRRAIEQQTDQAVFSPEGLIAATEAAPEVEEVQEQDGLIRDPATDDLTEEEQGEVDELEQRDQEVRRHEQAHKAAAGSYARGAAALEYTVGPDGKRYASGGNVKIDVSPERTPEATIRKMKVIQRAALAPAEPSAQDRGVYRTAVRQEQAAHQQLIEERQAESQSAREAGADQQNPLAPRRRPLIGPTSPPTATLDERV